MKVIFIGGHRGKARQLSLNGWAKVLLPVCLLGLPLGGGILLGLEFAGLRYGLMLDENLADVKDDLQQQRTDLEQAEQLSQARIASLTRKLAEMQARLIRLDALGERLTHMAQLDDGEFDFSEPPALGGPQEDVPSVLDKVYLENYYQDVVSHLDASEDQLLALSSLVSEHQFNKANTVTGRPVNKGWMSSRYGYRADPFTGKRAWHNGVDFAGKEGDSVVAVASGVVTWSGEKQGYGQMVELDHGEGYVTRYAHNLENLVSVGDLVKKGQKIALLGNSGRSTGPHVHFEVYKNGRSVDPASYIRRNLR